MYRNVKTCVSVNGKSSGFFLCNIAVRQGENLSPLLYLIFLNDLEDFLCQNGNINGVSCASDVNDTLHIFLKVFVLLYADDTVIISESAEDLQNALTAYAPYYEIWKLLINSSKTKHVFFFSKGRFQDYIFILNNETLEIVKESKYLGILFSRSGSFLDAKKHIAAQATRAMFCLLMKARSLLLPIDIQIDLFEKTVKPILIYGCEVIGTGNINRCSLNVWNLF